MGRCWENKKLNLGRINIIAYQCNGIEYNILEFKENMNNNFKENNLINFEQKIIQILKILRKNQ